EQSTTHIFNRFYRHLAGGLPKGQALQQAKRDYLNSELPSFQKSPYYWAGLVLIGDGAPVAFKTGWPLWMIAGGGLLLCGVLMVGYWLRR
ncbi:MAG: CHAT domain-containing protein, partial [Phaeodactylibacter sp.]|nr:CHAT domain-containing protein [Phaeodactylibacter sp.]